MVWITLTLTMLLFTTALYAVNPTSKDVDITSIDEHMKKMDAVLQEVRSHSQAQEQKYSAVLSSVLSQLTQTTEELSASKNITEELQQKVENLEEELKNMKETDNNKTLLDNTTAMKELEELKNSHNNTLLELKDLKQSHNQSLFKLEMIKNEVISLQQDFKNCSSSLSELDSSVHGLSQLKPTLTEISERRNVTNIQPTGGKWPWHYMAAGFSAYASATTIMPSGSVVFDIVQYNEGNGYNKANGYFTVPVSGTYMFWTNIIYKSNHTGIGCRIQTIETIFGFAFGMANEYYGTASETTMVNLNKGEMAWISCNRIGDVLGIHSSAGAVLIKPFSN